MSDIILLHIYFGNYEKCSKNTTTIENLYGGCLFIWILGSEENKSQVFSDLKFFRMLIPYITEFCGFEWTGPEYPTYKVIIDSFSYIWKTF